MNETGKILGTSDLNKSLKDLFGLGNPDKDLNSVTNALRNVENYAINLAGVLALIMILYSAFIYVTAYGDEGRAETAKKTLLWSIVGLALIIFSKVILIFVYKSLK